MKHLRNRLKDQDRIHIDQKTKIAYAKLYKELTKREGLKVLYWFAFNALNWKFLYQVLERI